MVHLARTRYEGANHTHLSELLSEREGIEIGRYTLRRILVNAGLSSPRSRRPPKHRVRRQRMTQAGMLVQIDGSLHRWLGEDGPQFTLLLAVDDATSAVVNAVFRPEEYTQGYFDLMQGLIERWRSTATATASSSFLAGRGRSSRRWRPPTSAAPWWNWASSRSSPAHARPSSLSHKSGTLKSINFFTPNYASKMAISDVSPTFACRRASKSVWLVLHETRPEAL